MKIRSIKKLQLKYYNIIYYILYYNIYYYVFLKRAVHAKKDFRVKM